MDKALHCLGPKKSNMTTLEPVDGRLLPVFPQSADLSVWVDEAVGEPSEDKPPVVGHARRKRQRGDDAVHEVSLLNEGRELRQLPEHRRRVTL